MDIEDAAQQSHGDQIAAHNIHETVSKTVAHSHQSEQLCPDGQKAALGEPAPHGTSQGCCNVQGCNAEGNTPIVPGPPHGASAVSEASKEADPPAQPSGPPESDLSKVNTAASAQAADQPACTPNSVVESTSTMPPEASAQPAGQAKPTLAPIFARAKPKQAKLPHAAHPLPPPTPPSGSSGLAPPGTSIKPEIAEASTEGAQRQGKHAAGIRHEVKDAASAGSLHQSESPDGEGGVKAMSGPGDQKSPKAVPIFGVRAGSKAKSQEQHEQAPPNAGGDDLLVDKSDEAAGCSVCPVMLQNTEENHLLHSLRQHKPVWVTALQQGSGFL